MGCLLSTLVHGRFTLYLSQYLLVTHTSATDAGHHVAALLACNAITVILLQFQIGRFLKREHLRYWIAGGTALLIVGWIGFSVADSLVGWCVAMFIFTLGEMIIYPADFLFVDTLAPEELRGSYYGAQNLAAPRCCKPGNVRVPADAHTGTEHVLRPQWSRGAGRLSVFCQWAQGCFNAKVMH